MKWIRMFSDAAEIIGEGVVTILFGSDDQAPPDTIPPRPPRRARDVDPSSFTVRVPTAAEHNAEIRNHIGGLFQYAGDLLREGIDSHEASSK